MFPPARLRHSAMSVVRPLSGDKRKRRRRGSKSGFDPQRTRAAHLAMTHDTVLVLRCAILPNRRRGPCRGEEAHECGIAIEGTRLGAARAAETGRQLSA